MRFWARDAVMSAASVWRATQRDHASAFGAAAYIEATKLTYLWHAALALGGCDAMSPCFLALPCVAGAMALTGAQNKLPEFIGFGVMTRGVLGLLGAWLAVGRHLGDIEPNF